MPSFCPFTDPPHPPHPPTPPPTHTHTHPTPPPTPTPTHPDGDAVYEAKPVWASLAALLHEGSADGVFQGTGHPTQTREGRSLTGAGGRACLPTPA